MRFDYKHLKGKGWSNEEISKTRIRLRKLEKKRKKNYWFADHIIFIYLLVFAIGLNLCIALIIMPFLLLIPNASIYVMVTAIGLAFGLLFGIVISEIEHFSKVKHWMYSVIVILLCILNFQRIYFAFDTVHNVVLLGAIYVLTFITPYLTLIYLRREHGKH